MVSKTGILMYCMKTDTIGDDARYLLSCDIMSKEYILNILGFADLVEKLKARQDHANTSY